MARTAPKTSPVRLRNNARTTPPAAPASGATNPPGDARPRKRAGRLASRGVILQAATTLFLRNGYLGTSMDDIAALAQVSKQTVYTHFADKQELFTQLVLGNIDVVEQLVSTLTRQLEDTNDVEHDLCELARSHLSAVLQPRVLQLRRLVIAESSRFPVLARTYYERVPERVFAALASGLERLAQRGLLQVEDPQLAAHHFVWLVLATPLDKAMFWGDAMNITSADIDRFAATGVPIFLSAYRAS
jgi:TetR/AcrR family transcriptional repressor of mexJK operon